MASTRTPEEIVKVSTLPFSHLLADSPEVKAVFPISNSTLFATLNILPTRHTQIKFFDMNGQQIAELDKNYVSQHVWSLSPERIFIGEMFHIYGYNLLTKEKTPKIEVPEGRQIYLGKGYLAIISKEHIMCKIHLTPDEHPYFRVEKDSTTTEYFSSDVVSIFDCNREFKKIAVISEFSDSKPLPREYKSLSEFDHAQAAHQIKHVTLTADDSLAIFNKAGSIKIIQDILEGQTACIEHQPDFLKEIGECQTALLESGELLIYGDFPHKEKRTPVAWGRPDVGREYIPCLRLFYAYQIEAKTVRSIPLPIPSDQCIHLKELLISNNGQTFYCKSENNMYMGNSVTGEINFAPLKAPEELRSLAHPVTASSLCMTDQDQMIVVWTDSNCFVSQRKSYFSVYNTADSLLNSISATIVSATTLPTPIGKVIASYYAESHSFFSLKQLPAESKSALVASQQRPN